MSVERNFIALIVIFFLVGCSSENKKQSTEQVNSQPSEVDYTSYTDNITIYRDEFGVPHIYGESDADAVFGMLYAQCEDDFNRVEMNYINASGRLAEVEGESEIYRDLRMKLFIDPQEIKALYEESPEWLKKLMDAYAAGINYYLDTHPEVKPKVISKFEPWMALTFSEGSIGGDIERISTSGLNDFYGESGESQTASVWFKDDFLEEPRGSNGISIAPSLTESGNALFLINPHTTFFFRSEMHVVSNEGLNAYGAVTWGQFFIYQGFNDRLGWMHTSSRADAIDYFLETVEEREGKYVYRYGDEWREVEEKKIVVPFKDGEEVKEREIIAYYTHRGPVIGTEGDKWITISLMHRPKDALIQSYTRTKARNYDEFYKSMEIRTNSSNNTVYADADGNIGYFHGNFIPRRDPSFDWSKPVDGTDPATEWGDLHSVDEMVMIKNPRNGWIQNCNSTPFTASGKYSPKAENYEKYMAPDNENFRGIHAVKVLDGKSGWTLESLISAAYDPYIPGFEYIVTPLLKAYEENSNPDLEEPIGALKKWKFRTFKKSIPTTLAVYYGNELLRMARNTPDREGNIYEWVVENTSPEQKIEAFTVAVNTLVEDFGTWKIPWGDVNRYQRNDGKIRQDFSDQRPSLAVGLNSGRWGALASYGSRKYPGTKKFYGTSGNSFVAFVEFGDSIRAKSILTGGQSGNPASKHFSDQAEMYTTSKFKDVHFYLQDVEEYAQKKYKPGETP